MHKPRRQIFWIGATLLLGLLLLVGVGQYRNGVHAQQSLAQARARWETRPFSAYQLQIGQETRTRQCAQHILARDERTTEAQHNSCGQPPTWTVTRLFNWIAELERSPVRCYPGPARCACRAKAQVDVTYDPVLGYPQAVVYEWRRGPNYFSAAYWQSLTDQSFPGCENIEAGGTLVMYVSLEPEP